MPYTLDQLAKAAGLNRHVLRNWTRFGVLPPPTLRGMNTRYDDEQLQHALAIKHLRETGMKLSAIKARLAKSSREEIEQLAGVAPKPTPAPEHAPGAPPGPEPAPAPALGPWRAEAAFPRELWERIVLCPGVVLSVRADADSEARRVAREIESTYALRVVRG